MEKIKDANAPTVDEARKPKKVKFGGLYEFMSSLITAIIAIVVLFLFLIRPVGVSGSSMVPTLENGDWLIVSPIKSSFDYKDIVIVVEPNSLNEPIVKRVIATGGQWVTVNYEDGHVYVGDSPNNLKKLDEPYTNSLTDSKGMDDTNEYPIQVPEGQLFCMGDNRNHSTDSRSYLVGFIDERYVLGKAECRLMPFGHFSIYENSK